MKKGAKTEERVVEPTTPARRRAGDSDGHGVWLEQVPHARLVSLAALGAVGAAAGYGYLAARGGAATWLELLVAVAAAAVLLLHPARVAWWVALVAAALYVAVEAGAGRLSHGIDVRQVAAVLLLGCSLMCASGLRLGIRRRDTELSVAVDAIDQLTRRDRITELLSGGREPTWLEAELARARRHHHQLALLLVRPDRFDEFRALGGTVGQELLETVAEVIGDELRSTDFALRFAPATFALILPETSAEGARVAAERLRLLLPFRVRARNLGEISLSCGIASFPRDATTNDELVVVAERALDRAAELGGNRTIVASLETSAPRGWALSE
jgi:diguanylate cyclase (GGDEF)-like protein